MSGTVKERESIDEGGEAIICIPPVTGRDRDGGISRSHSGCEGVKPRDSRDSREGNDKQKTAPTNGDNAPFIIRIEDSSE